MRMSTAKIPMALETELERSSRRLQLSVEILMHTGTSVRPSSPLNYDIQSLTFVDLVGQRSCTTPF